MSNALEWMVDLTEYVCVQHTKKTVFIIGVFTAWCFV